MYVVMDCVACHCIALQLHGHCIANALYCIVSNHNICVMNRCAPRPHERVSIALRISAPENRCGFMYCIILYNTVSIA